MTKPLIVGMSNPHGGGPEMALHPSIRGGSGAHLFSMIREAAEADLQQSFSEQEYIDSFDRINMVEQPDWSAAVAREARDQVLSRIGDNAVILGSVVPACLGLRAYVNNGGWWQWVEEFPGGIRKHYCVVPHPSGLNRLYNDPANRRRTGKLLLDLAREPKF